MLACFNLQSLLFPFSQWAGILDKPRCIFAQILTGILANRTLEDGASSALLHSMYGTPTPTPIFGFRQHPPKCAQKHNASGTAVGLFRANFRREVHLLFSRGPKHGNRSDPRHQETHSSFEDSPRWGPTVQLRLPRWLQRGRGLVHIHRHPTCQ